MLETAMKTLAFITAGVHQDRDAIGLFHMQDGHLNGLILPKGCVKLDDIPIHRYEPEIPFAFPNNQDRMVDFARSHPGYRETEYTGDISLIVNSLWTSIDEMKFADYCLKHKLVPGTTEISDTNVNFRTSVLEQGLFSVPKLLGFRRYPKALTEVKMFNKYAECKQTLKGLKRYLDGNVVRQNIGAVDLVFLDDDSGIAFEIKSTEGQGKRKMKQRLLTTKKQLFKARKFCWHSWGIEVSLAGMVGRLNYKGKIKVKKGRRSEYVDRYSVLMYLQRFGMKKINGSKVDIGPTSHPKKFYFPDTNLYKYT